METMEAPKRTPRRRGQVRFPEQLHPRCAAGTLARIQRIADADGTTDQDVMRRYIREGLARDERERGLHPLQGGDDGR